ncbi:hypothetical protein BKA61DRAFT_583340 [Leptodontidium sp. MPI-SDFR-AT-0119]|nr:hypothetical protein BKA61DRAFT_583340 [Leptodontidium sp. MPI-SDFR-AT-0119]
MRSVFSHMVAAASLASFASGVRLQKSVTCPAIPMVNNFSPLPSTNNYDGVSSQNGEFNFTVGNNFNFGSTLSGTATKQLRTMLDVLDSGVQFDFTFDITAPKILNTGIGGYFTFGSTKTAQWPMPSGRTTGTLTRVLD